MSQITYRCTAPDHFPEKHIGHELEVLTGWDRPLQHFFLTIFDVTNKKRLELLYDLADDDLDEDAYYEDEYPDIVYSSIGLSDFESAGAIAEELTRMGLDVPHVLVTTLEHHCAQNAGNLCVSL